MTNYDLWLTTEPRELSYLIADDVRAFDMGQAVRSIRKGFHFGHEGTIVDVELKADGSRRWTVLFCDQSIDSDGSGDEIETFRESELRAV